MSDGDLLLDDYGDLVVDAGGDATVIDGMDTLIQDIRHRLMTVKGSLVDDPEYGASLPLFLHQCSHPAGRRDIANSCIEELAKEERILQQCTQVQVIPTDGKTINIKVSFVRLSDLQSGSLEIGL